jgi:hypothetical protein
VARSAALAGNAASFPAKGSPVYYSHYTDHTYCGTEQLRPRWHFPNASSSVFRETDVYSPLRAYFPTKPFHPFRHPETFRMIETYDMTNDDLSFYGLASDIVGTLDPRVRARLSLCRQCLEDDPPPIIQHYLYEVIYQHAPTLINVIQNPDLATRPFLIPNDHVCFTRDVLPALPLNTINSFMTTIKSSINGIKMDKTFYMLMWAMLSKTFTRACAIRNIIDIMASAYPHRAIVDLNIDVTLLYGFLGAYPSAKVRPTMPVALAVIASFRHLANLTFKQYERFIFQYFHLIFFSWSMYCIDHVENMPVLDAILHMFPSRQTYVEDIRSTLDRCRQLLNKHIEPFAMEIARDPVHLSAETRAAWQAFMLEGNNLYEVYRSVRSKRYIIRPAEPPCSTISLNVRSELRAAFRKGILPADCQPTITRTPHGCHPVLTQEEMRALYIVAVLNMSIASYPIVEFMHIFGLKQELVDKIRRSITKFCCRGGKKHAFTKYTRKWIAIDPRGTMFFQQYLEFCSVISGIYLMPLPLNVRNNQERAIRKKFELYGPNIPETFGNFYYCLGCESKLSLDVVHPRADCMMFYSIHSVRNIADPTQYSTVRVYNNRCGREINADILKQITRVGATTHCQVPILNLSGEVVCSGKKRHQDHGKSWCNMPVSHVNLIGHIFYLNHAAYTICVICGSICHYMPNFFGSEGPTCSVHRPMLATFYYEQSSYYVKDDTLNAFLNRDRRPALVWMCEIDSCRRRCRSERASIADHQECIGIEKDGSLRLMRLCESHYKTLTIMLRGNSDERTVMPILSIALIQRMLQKYGEGDVRKIFFTLVGAKTECYRIKK